MRNGHMGKKMKRVIAALLTVTLFASDHAILYGAEADAGIAAESEAVHQESAADTDSGEQETYGDTAEGRRQAMSTTWCSCWKIPIWRKAEALPLQMDL